MADSKYQRLFTEEDMIAFVETCLEADVENENETREQLDKFDGKFPRDEPLFLLRGQDKFALPTIEEYGFEVSDSSNKEFVAGVDVAQAEFEKFAKDNPDRVKIPD